MGRLPSPGVGWYRRRFELPAAEAGHRVSPEVEGAMACAAVWLNGHLVGGWPYGYASWRVELTPGGPLGAAFYPRAAGRQLEILRQMGCNAIRTAHEPPTPGLLELTDRMGFLVLDEIFDCWERRKTPNDLYRIFPEWHEADLRAFVRRDRNHPSVILWSIGNEVGEPYTGEPARRWRGGCTGS